MNAPATAQGQAGQIGNGRVAQLDSHARLLRDVSAWPPPVRGSRRARPDAIIVPATRPASSLTKLIETATALGALVVVLCSQQAKLDQVAERIRRVPFARGIAIELGDDYESPTGQLRTMSDEFVVPNAGRSSDLSLKRNFGLLLARRLGKHKIVFVDDDITVSGDALARLAQQLDTVQIAGMVCKSFADNSVACHARRLAGFRQDVFVTGAVLGVNCADHPVPFFPDVYDEDWFFCGDAAVAGKLTKAGQAHQVEYDPYAAPSRAEHEEFGDLLAEGLYSLIGSHNDADSLDGILRLATSRYWESFIEVRRQSLGVTRAALVKLNSNPHVADNVATAIKSLDAADNRYRESPITPDQCAGFLDAFQSDAEMWRRAYQRANAVVATIDAVASLGALRWELVR